MKKGKLERKEILLPSELHVVDAQGMGQGREGEIKL